MKKMLIFMLVLGLASTVSATVTMELRESDGTTPVADLENLALGADYVLVVEGATADAGASVGIYGSTYTAADWANLGSADLANAKTLVDTGNLSYINYVAAYVGFDGLADDNGMGPGVSTGDWFTIDLTALAVGDFDLDLIDYGAGSAVIDSVSGSIPEPMTIALLGLGGLFLRRRK